MTKRFRSLAAFAVATILATGVAACGGSDDEGGSGGGTPTITFSTGGALPPNEMEQAIFSDQLIDKGILKNYGKAYDFKLISVKGTPEAQSLLISGQADLGVLAFSTMATGAAQDAIPSGFSIVAGEFVDGVPGYATNQYLVSPDSGIESADDLSGKTLGVNAVGSAVDILLRVWLQEEGLDPDSDVEFAELEFPTMGPALEGGRIDLGSFVLPFQATAEEEGIGKSLFTAKDAVGENAAIAVVGRNDFLEGNEDAVRAFFEDWVAGLQWLIDPANRQEAIQIISGITGTPPSTLDLFYNEKGSDYYRDPNACPPGKALQTGVEAMVETGYLPESVDLESLVDTSYLPGKCESPSGGGS